MFAVTILTPHIRSFGRMLCYFISKQDVSARGSKYCATGVAQSGEQVTDRTIGDSVGAPGAM